MAKGTATLTLPASRGPHSIMALARIRRSQTFTTTTPNLPPPTTILSLPAELVDLILSSCTNPALVALSQTCTSLHAIALHTFFKRNSIMDPVNGWLSARKAPRETLDAIRVALFVKKLSMLNWYFNPGWECNICNSLEEHGDTDEQGLCSCRQESGSDIHTGTADSGSRMGPLNRTLAEVANLRAIVSHVGDVGSVSLHFSVVGLWLRIQARDHPQICLDQVDGDRWRASLVGLLDQVLDKGCEDLNIYAGEELKDLYRNQNSKVENELPLPITMQATTNNHESHHAAMQVGNQPRKQLLEASLRLPIKRLTDLVHRILKTSDPSLEGNLKDAQTRTKRRQSKLKKLRLHSDMLLLPPFYDWTLSLLSSSSSACASTLTRLSIKPATITIPSSFFASVSLPNLIDFEITVTLTIPRNGSETGLANFEDIARFLGRHGSHLKKVYLYGVGVPPLPGREVISGSTTSTPIFDPHKPIFPHLLSFSAHPAYIMWLLELVISAPLLSPFFWQRNKNLGNLTSIGITSEYYISAPDFDYALFNQALSALVRFCRWRNGERGPRLGIEKEPKTKKKNKGKTIELILTFASQQGVGEWFAGHLSSSLEHAINQTSSERPAPAPVPPSIVTQLTHVSRLTISTFHFVKLPEQTLDILPDWLALISNSTGSVSSATGSGTPSTLQLVKFTDHPAEGFPGDRSDEGLFAKRVAEKCVGLKQIQLQWNSLIDLDKARAELKAGPRDDNGNNRRV